MTPLFYLFITMIATAFVFFRVAKKMQMRPIEVADSLGLILAIEALFYLIYLISKNLWDKF